MAPRKEKVDKGSGDQGMFNSFSPDLRRRLRKLSPIASEVVLNYLRTLTHPRRFLSQVYY